jgi:S-DNA-T family DNA segregation ATPase FtsK/SpoIIIE
VFVGNDITDALTRLRQLQTEMDSRYDLLAAERRRKITQADQVDVIMLVVDEIAYFSATVGDKKTQDEFVRLLRDLVARGRAAGIIVVAATQRPSADIIPTSLRDLFGYRLAFRCTTDISSDIILGYGWAKQGYSAATIAPEDRGVGWLLAEGGTPRRIKAAYLSDADIYLLVDQAASIRQHRSDGGEAA